MASFETRKLTIEFSNACFSLMGGHSGGAINIHLYAGAVRSLIGKKEKGSEHKEEYDLREPPGSKFFNGNGNEDEYAVFVVNENKR